MLHLRPALCASLALTLAGACADAGGANPTPPDQPDAGKDAGMNTPPSDGSDGDDADASRPSTDAGGSENERPDAGSGAEPTVRFVVLGDAGTASEDQFAVARSIETVCQTRGCDFALHLGDNIYEVGVTELTDTQFMTKFEEPYANLDFPFYVALGNHDYGGFPAGTNFLIDDTRSALQVEYTARSSKWYMPDFFYSVRREHVELFALDTNAVIVKDYRPLAMQQAWLDEKLSQSDARWKIVFGHHAYLSNGDHGNAGSYDTNKCVLGICPDNGAPIKQLVEESICGKADIYFAAHDHNREWLAPTCGTNFFVSGAGGKDLRPLQDENAPNSLFADATKFGFLWVEIAGDVMTGAFYDADGNVDYEDVITR